MGLVVQGTKGDMNDRRLLVTALQLCLFFFDGYKLILYFENSSFSFLAFHP